MSSLLYAAHVIVHRKHNRERTEADLIGAARALIADRAYDSIRVRDIAETAGCNHGLITHYFGTKLGLFTRVLHELSGEIGDVIAQPGSARAVLEHPSITTYWRLLAALLDAGLSPEVAIADSRPAMDQLVQRASELAGVDLSDERTIATFVMLMVGGFHVFGDVLFSSAERGVSRDDASTQFVWVLSTILEGLRRRNR